MNVRIVDFPETRIAALEHLGPPEREHETARRLIEWRLAHRLSPERHRTFGIHYTDPRTTPPHAHRVDFAVEFTQEVAPNPQGVVGKLIPGGRCAVVRHGGSREDIPAAVYLYEVWLPQSGEALRDFPIFFHYVNVGPNVTEHEMLTDVYLPLR
ncbi:MAG TPA: GyrI-like domain-containing protein [Steroidobacteraceae bacterium]|nr:GyrI-like domain-containing protein [Steroidobacteraceae bacterium]